MGIFNTSVAVEFQERLTPGEREILVALAEGLTVPRAATQFGISPSTVASHVRSIYAKLGISSRAQAALAAQRLGFLQVR